MWLRCVSPSDTETSVSADTHPDHFLVAYTAEADSPSYEGLRFLLQWSWTSAGTRWPRVSSCKATRTPLARISSSACTYSQTNGPDRTRSPNTDWSSTNAVGVPTLPSYHGHQLLRLPEQVDAQSLAFASRPPASP